MAERKMENKVGPHHLGLVAAAVEETFVDDDVAGAREGPESFNDPVVDAFEPLVVDGQVTNQLLPLAEADVAVFHRALAREVLRGLVVQLKHKSTLLIMTSRNGQVVLFAINAIT